MSVSATEDGKLCINGNNIAVFSEKDPKLIPWSSAGKNSILGCVNRSDTRFTLIEIEICSSSSE